ncbi:hypothetical protein [Streptomyces sp. MAR4 CNX-425]|uniref:hypothetical protein n=1 Tax=Streptomyces sp. MAR4 CNX-425 TaxID=3406343 RepID=UPI003B50A2D8
MELDTRPGGRSAGAAAVDDAGEAVGVRGTADLPAVAVRWDAAGAVTRLETPGRGDRR